jgi:hypothetical protein
MNTLSSQYANRQWNQAAFAAIEKGEHCITKEAIIAILQFLKGRQP